MLVDVLTGLSDPAELELCECEDDTDAPLMLAIRQAFVRVLARS